MFKNLFKNTTAGETEEVNLDPAKMPATHCHYYGWQWPVGSTPRITAGCRS